MTTDFATNFQKITAGQTIGDIAKATGCDHGSISRYHSGDREPNLARLRRIALAYKVSADMLLGIEQEAA